MSGDVSMHSCKQLHRMAFEPMQTPLMNNQGLTLATKHAKWKPPRYPRFAPYKFLAFAQARTRRSSCPNVDTLGTERRRSREAATPINASTMDTSVANDAAHCGFTSTCQRHHNNTRNTAMQGGVNGTTAREYQLQKFANLSLREHCLRGVPCIR